MRYMYMKSQSRLWIRSAAYVGFALAVQTKKKLLGPSNLKLLVIHELYIYVSTVKKSKKYLHS